ncbi:hypothetical protein C6P45_005177 [Maudiozyma exigua]|uniref:PA14 domain-containing protein n=1 Tax=Maudiozyma exigua TaxID=34358 RepID=A0A9P7BAM9_MAUEX|nr:hypothetical protein C6P45_005177 [Kazachstania exigua]
MIKLSFFKIISIVIATQSLSAATIQTENLGKLNLLPGLTARLYNTSLTSGDDYDHHYNYLQEKQFLTDGGQLLSQRVITSVQTNWTKGVNNCMFGFYRDEHDVVLELRGYIKAPADGVFDIYAGLEAVFDPDGNYIPQFEGGYWIIKNAISLNETSNGFICSYDSNESNYSSMSPEEICKDICSPMGSQEFAIFVKDQYYPVVFYTYFSGEALVNDWVFQVDDNVYPFDENIYYYPNDDFETNDANLDADFPEICPQFHDKVFIPQNFVEENATHLNECPLPPISPSELPSFTSSNIPLISSPDSPSFTYSIVPTSSFKPSSSASFSALNSSSGTQTLSSTTPSSISSTSSSSIFHSSNGSSSVPSSLGTQSKSGNISSHSTERGSISTSETTKTSYLLPSDSLKSSSFISPGEKPIYTANKTTSNSQDHTQTDRPIVMTSSLSSKVEVSGISDNISTTVVSKSEIDTLTRITDPETEHNISRYVTYSSLVVSNPESARIRSNTVPLTTQATVINGVTKPTVRQDDTVITYIECTRYTCLQGNGASVSEVEINSTGNSFRSANMGIHIETSAVIADVPTPRLIITGDHSTSAAVQPFSDECYSSTYQPLLLGIAILIAFI